MLLKKPGFSEKPGFFGDVPAMHVSLVHVGVSTETEHWFDGAGTGSLTACSTVPARAAEHACT